ncbi:ABC transporter ATP-binding protein [Dactylosporangium siamense]|uniref:Nickel import system ATP-binding protein NikD n=1 Tax=Dactylosporangium siamense TaxID=685454 RepID=A0A919PM19_9ACTN|nr:ABC transporter ATP-binding protein [Dactylosporangium siamense]GIG44900.1 ABC transporter ATP-binding protein [Dactylosporangium siamense]
MTAALTIDGLNVRFRLRDATVHAVTDLSLTLHRGELLAVVGESGCGKSVLAHAVLDLLPANAATTGTVQFGAGSRPVRELRGRHIGLIPQSPATALTPVRTGRSLLAETLRVHGRATTDADTVAAEAGLDPADLDRYPFQLSGGMAQRLATALAIAPDPAVLLADEPTAGLDRPLVDHTLDLLRRRCAAGTAVMLITHDLTAAQRVADTVAVMYASRIVEHRPADEFFTAPHHPYAAALLDSLPDRAFQPIPGHPPMLTDLPAGCAFAPRCPHASPDCAAQPAISDGAACHHPLSVVGAP